MPSWTKELEARLASLRLRPAREREIIDELSEHLELRYAELRDQGVDEAEAFALVRAELLDDEALAEFMRPLRQANAPPPPGPVGAPRRQVHCRRSSHEPHRLLRFRRPRSTPRGAQLAAAARLRVAAVLTLALGIGATTAIFSVVYSVLIKPLPYANADELVRIRHTAPGFGVVDMVPTRTCTSRTGKRTGRSPLSACGGRSPQRSPIAARRSACRRCESRTARFRRLEFSRRAAVGSRERSTMSRPTVRRP